MHHHLSLLLRLKHNLMWNWTWRSIEATVFIYKLIIYLLLLDIVATCLYRMIDTTLQTITKYVWLWPSINTTLYRRMRILSKRYFGVIRILHRLIRGLKFLYFRIILTSTELWVSYFFNRYFLFPFYLCNTLTLRQLYNDLFQI